MLQQDYVERCYAGWLGKMIGVRLGVPIEGWSSERIRRELGEITGYTQEYHDLCADDDTNGPVFLARALRDYGPDASAEDMGRTLLNYAPSERGFFWWGGYGVSTEHTAYANLRAGIPAPRSGSIRQNGATVAEQIGGQIFVDCWGLMNPRNPARAADYAQRAASVTHDGNGVYGARFVAACIAAAFGAGTAREVIEAGLAQIPPDCEYARMARDILRYRDERGGDWQSAFAYILANWGYDRYPGICHIIPNAAVMLAALLYGENDFSKTLCICAMCGWDTDCNAGNVGAMMGALVGLDGIASHWIDPMHDFLACSSVIGSLNALDVPAYVAELARDAYRLAGEAYPERWRDVLEGKAARYHFELSRSTHSLRMEGPGTLENTTGAAHSGQRGLRVRAADRAEATVYVKTYYCEQDFTDCRYDPDFSPLVYPGQTVSLWLRAADGRNDLTASLWAKGFGGDVLLMGEATRLSPNEWTRLSLRLDCARDALVRAVGVTVRGETAPAFDLDDMDFGGKADYAIDFTQPLPKHNWSLTHHGVPQTTVLAGIWGLDHGALCGSGTAMCEAYTGDVAWRDIEAETVLVPHIGGCFRFLFRVQGAERCYAATLRPGRLAIEKKDGAFAELAACTFDWTLDQPVCLRVSARGDQLAVSVGEARLCAQDTAYTDGQLGWGLERGRMGVLHLSAREQSEAMADSFE